MSVGNINSIMARNIYGMNPAVAQQQQQQSFGAQPLKGIQGNPQSFQGQGVEGGLFAGKAGVPPVSAVQGRNQQNQGNQGLEQRLAGINGELTPVVAGNEFLAKKMDFMA